MITDLLSDLQSRGLPWFRQVRRASWIISTIVSPLSHLTQIGPFGLRFSGFPGVTKNRSSAPCGPVRADSDRLSDRLPSMSLPTGQNLHVNLHAGILR